MSSKKRWASPGWAWELELLALVFVITSLAIPFYLSYVEGPPPSDVSLVQRAEQDRQSVAAQATLEEQRAFFWAVIIIGLYIGHIIIAHSSVELISTSFIYIFSPLVFSMITYYRLYMLSLQEKAVDIVQGTPTEVAIWAGGVLCITSLVARLRMSRHMGRFKDVEWDIVSRSPIDSTYFSKLAITMRPLIYPPRCYRACSEGILIEGWLYVMPVSFRMIKSVEAVKKVRMMTTGRYLARSAKHLIRIQLTEHAMPLFIAPDNRDAFIAYCNEHLHRGVVTLARDTSHDDDDG